MGCGAQPPTPSRAPHLYPPWGLLQAAQAWTHAQAVPLTAARAAVWRLLIPNQTAWAPRNVDPLLKKMCPWLWGSRAAQIQPKGESPLSEKICVLSVPQGIQPSEHLAVPLTPWERNQEFLTRPGQEGYHGRARHASRPFAARHPHPDISSWGFGVRPEP